MRFYWCCALAVLFVLVRIPASAEVSADHPVPSTRFPPLPELPPSGEGGKAKGFPDFSAAISIQLQNDWIYESRDQDQERVDLYTTIEAALGVAFSKEISLESGLVFEPVDDQDPGEDRYFGDEGLFVEQLFFEYHRDSFSIQAGKLNPAFGIAWYLAPGVYGPDLAEDYELTEAWGLQFKLEGMSEYTGRLTWTGASFSADTTVLSESAFNPRYYDVERKYDHNRVRLGGPGNTGNLDSFSTTLTGDEIPGLPGLLWNVGFSHLENDDPGMQDQRSVSAGALYQFEVAGGIVGNVLVEGVHQDHADGVDGDDRRYVTVSGSVSMRSWNVAASYTHRKLDAGLDPNVRDELYQLSVGYAFALGLTVDLAYVHIEQEDIPSNGMGLLVSYYWGR